MRALNMLSQFLLLHKSLITHLTSKIRGDTFPLLLRRLLMVKLIQNGVDLSYDRIALRGLRLCQVYGDRKVLSSVFTSLLLKITITSLDVFL